MRKTLLWYSAEARRVWTIPAGREAVTLHWGVQILSPLEKSSTCTRLCAEREPAALLSIEAVWDEPRGRWRRFKPREEREWEPFCIWGFSDGTKNVLVR